MTSLQLPSSLVSVSWLQQHLGHPQLLLFDASWHMPATGRDAFAEWQQERIGGARFFDFDGRCYHLLLGCRKITVTECNINCQLQMLTQSTSFSGRLLKHKLIHIQLE